MRHGSNIDPPNRFEKVQIELQTDQLEWEADYLHSLTNRRIEYFDDTSSTIVSTNNSPDLPFRYSVNPYRGCAHGCPYCYARNTHEYLGLSAGLNFETKIFVKRDADTLLRKFLSRPAWKSEMILFSGVTDCYQPAERQFQLTRRCIDVARQFNQAIAITTKNALVARDLDLLSEMAAKRQVVVNMSLATLDVELARSMEPRASVPAARLRAIGELSRQGVPVRVLVAPIVPGLNDSEIPAVLSAAREAGAMGARYILLRLPLTVEPVFFEWLQRERPEQAARVESRIRATRRGELSHSGFGERMKGSGEMANQIGRLFHIHSQRLGFSELPDLDFSNFCVPASESQQRTFDW